MDYLYLRPRSGLEQVLPAVFIIKHTPDLVLHRLDVGPVCG